MENDLPNIHDYVPCYSSWVHRECHKFLFAKVPNWELVTPTQCKMEPENISKEVSEIPSPDLFSDSMLKL